MVLTCITSFVGPWTWQPGPCPPCGGGCASVKPTTCSHVRSNNVQRRACMVVWDTWICFTSCALQLLPSHLGGALGTSRNDGRCFQGCQTTRKALYLPQEKAVLDFQRRKTHLRVKTVIVVKSPSDLDTKRGSYAPSKIFHTNWKWPTSVERGGIHSRTQPT